MKCSAPRKYFQLDDTWIFTALLHVALMTDLCNVLDDGDVAGSCRPSDRNTDAGDPPFQQR